MNATLASVGADAILLLHVAVVLFVVGAEAGILLGARRGWRWIRSRRLRVAHLALVALIALQAWLGQRCPLTIWEQALRQRAGDAGYGQGFIEYWLARLLYVDAPWWAFVAAYTAFALLVALTWRTLPPAPRRSRTAR